MKTFYRNLEILKALEQNQTLVKQGYTVKQIIEDLFSLMFENVWDLNTPLRKYTAFHPLSDLDKEQIVFTKPDAFTRTILRKSGIEIKFIGSLEKHATAKQVHDYIMDIVGGYVLNEKILLENLKHQLIKIVSNAQEFGIQLSTKDVPLLQGCYHSHKLNISDCGTTLNLSCISKLSLYL